MERETASEHGGRGVAVETFTCSTGRMKPRFPVIPAAENASRATLFCPEASVKLEAVPMVVPVALRKDTLPVQDAAVPVDELLAVFTTITSAVSVLPSPV